VYTVYTVYYTGPTILCILYTAYAIHPTTLPGPLYSVYYTPYHSAMPTIHPTSIALLVVERTTTTTTTLLDPNTTTTSTAPYYSAVPTHILPCPCIYWGHCTALHCTALLCTAYTEDTAPRCAVHSTPGRICIFQEIAVATIPVQCSAVQCSAVQCSAVQCSAAAVACLPAL
jgi:hypothetical protein